MTGTAPASARALPHPARRWSWAHPEWWALGFSGAAWAALAAGSAGTSGHAGHGGGPSWRTAAMVTAMMVPLVVPHVRFVAGSSLWRRRHVAVAWFLSGYLGLWGAAQVGLEAGWLWASSRVGVTGAVWALIACAALWEVAPGERQRRRRCHRVTPLAPRGWEANAACVRFGVATGVRCFAVCWAAMLLCSVFSHGLLVMAGVFGVQWSSRYHVSVSKWWRAVALFAVGALGLMLHTP